MTMSIRGFCRTHGKNFSGMNCPDCLAVDSVQFKEEQKLFASLHEHLNAMFQLPDIGEWKLDVIWEEVKESTEVQELMKLHSNSVAKNLILFRVKETLSSYVKNYIGGKEL